MIKLNSTVTRLLKAPVSELVYLLKIGDILKTTSFYSDFNLYSNGALYETYPADGKLVRVDPPAVTSSVDKNSYTIIMTDPGFSQGQDMETKWSSLPVEIRAVFINVENTNQLNSRGGIVKPNYPYNEMVDTLLLYRGIIESVFYDIDTNEAGEVLISVVCSSPMHNLDFKRTVRLNKDSIRDQYPTDSCCDNIYEGSGKVRLSWGKV